MFKKAQEGIWDARRLFFASLAGLILLGAFVGCSGGATASGGDTGGGSTTNDSSSGDLSGIAQTPDASWHSQYLVGAHSTMDCSTCHTSTARESADIGGADIVSGNVGEGKDQALCYRCHASNYTNAVFKHSEYSIGTYCNSCHYSDSFNSHNRVPISQWHGSITDSCATCHSDAAPASHGSDRRSGCENCHSYSNGWSASSSSSEHSTENCENCHLSKMPAGHYGTTCADCHEFPKWSDASGSFSHSGITSGCKSCHSAHFDSFECEWCHTSGISWSYRHSAITTNACSACHDWDDDGGDDKGDDDKGDDDKGDDDKGDDNKGDDNKGDDN